MLSTRAQQSVIHGYLAVVWPDTTNACTSTPHKLVLTALVCHHEIRDHIQDYHSCFSLRATGCTILVTLFSLATNMVVKSAEVECRIPLTKSSVQQPPNRAFMEDLMVRDLMGESCTVICLR